MNRKIFGPLLGEPTTSALNPDQPYFCQNLDRMQDGIFRPRRGLTAGAGSDVLAPFLIDATVINCVVAVEDIVAPPSRTDLVLIAGDDGLLRVDGGAAFSPSIPCDWVSVHSGYAIALSSSRKSIRFSGYFLPQSWDVLDEISVPHEIGTPLAIVPWQVGISFVIGENGIAELQGLSSSEFSFRPTYALAASPITKTIAKIDEQVFFTIEGPRIVRLGQGAPQVISAPIERELRAASPSAGWHDSVNGFYSLSIGGTAYNFSIERNVWTGNFVSSLGGFEGGNRDAVVIGGALYTWTTGGSETIACIIQTIPDSGVRLNNSKQCRSVAVDADGTGTVSILMMQNMSAEFSGSSLTLGTAGFPAVYQGNLSTYKRSLISVASSDPLFRFRGVEVNEIDRGGYA